MAARRAIEVAPAGQVGFFSHLCLVPKPGDKWRPILDWVVSIDLIDAYFDIPIRPSHRRFLSFCHIGRVWQFRALLFGLSTAPWIFTRVRDEVRKMAALHDITIYIFWTTG